jgi:hypothetical protein
MKDFYEKNYNKSDKTKTIDFWEEVIIVKTGLQLKAIRTF